MSVKERTADTEQMGVQGTTRNGVNGSPTKQTGSQSEARSVLQNVKQASAGGLVHKPAALVSQRHLTRVLQSRAPARSARPLGTKVDGLPFCVARCEAFTALCRGCRYRFVSRRVGGRSFCLAVHGSEARA